MQANLDALVALALIVALLLGTLALTGFLAVRIGEQRLWSTTMPAVRSGAAPPTDNPQCHAVRQHY